MKAVKKYPHGGKTDPPNGKKKKSNTAKIMGLTGRQRVYTRTVPKARQDFSDPSKLGEQYHYKGDLVAPAHNIHTKDGLRIKGYGQVSRAKDPTKRGKKGGKRARPAGKK